MQTGTIYTLTDPRDDRIRYVGKTTKTATERLAGHLASPSNPAMRVWINALALQGLTPRIRTIATPSIDRLAAEEEKQIAAHARAGHRIFNAPYYHQNLADLYLSPKASAAARAANEPPKNQIDQYAHTAYGPLAAERAAGLKSAGRTAAEVVVRAPFLALLYCWATLNVKPVRALFFTGIAAAGLWEVGFDHLVREQVLPRLPVHEALAFWREYLERPATNLGVTFLAIHLLMALLSYLPVANAARAAAPEAAGKGGPTTSSAEVAAAAAAALDAALPKQSDHRS